MLSFTCDWTPGGGLLGDVRGVRVERRWRLAEADARLLVHLRRDVLDDVELRALVEHDAVVELASGARS